MIRINLRLSSSLGACLGSWPMGIGLTPELAEMERELIRLGSDRLKTVLESSSKWGLRIQPIWSLPWTWPTTIWWVQATWTRWAITTLDRVCIPMQSCKEIKHILLIPTSAWEVLVRGRSSNVIWTSAMKNHNHHQATEADEAGTIRETRVQDHKGSSKFSSRLTRSRSR